MGNQQPDDQGAPERWQRTWRFWLIATVVVVVAGLLFSPILFSVLRGAHPSARTFAAPRQTQTTSSELQPEHFSASQARTAAQLDDLLTQRLASQRFSGSVLVARKGQILLEKGYGLANWETRTANMPATRFYLGSVTKEFTATAILLLQAQGKLNIQSPLCSYLKPCPQPWQQISLHEMLTHTSGIPQLDDSQLANTSPQAWLASFDTVPLQFSPSDQFQYCNICYQILAYVVQQVSGMPYTRFVQQMILRPLHMQASGFGPETYYADPHAALGYANWQKSAEQLGVHTGSAWSFLAGSGMLYSTVQDLYRWDQALSANTLLPRALQDLAFTPYVNATALFPGARYGYGWFISQSPVQGHQIIWHDGIIDGFRNYIGRYVNDDLTIIILSNLSSVDSVSLAHSLEHILLT